MIIHTYACAYSHACKHLEIHIQTHVHVCAMKQTFTDKHACMRLGQIFVFCLSPKSLYSIQNSSIHYYIIFPPKVKHKCSKLMHQFAG